MSKEAKNEIDLMLRQMGRREDAAVFESDAQHLDADELNSYVANALPAPARVRYMQHLADCASCRRLVAQLSAAEGPIVVQAAGTVPAPSALKQFLASLFSPMVLRYAIPALGVLVIMVVGFVVMRREAAKDSVAEVMRRDQNGTVAIPRAASPQPSDRIQQFQLNEENAKREGESETQKPSRGQAEASADARTGQSSGAAAPVTVNETPRVETPAQPESKAAASEPPPAPKAVTTESQDAARRADREKKAPADSPSPAKLAEVTVSERGANTAPQTQQTQVAAAPAAGVNRSLEVGRLSTAGAADRAGKTRRPAKDEERDAVDKTTAKDDAAKEKNKTEAETRSVAGRQFRKSGSVWIDTAYDRSQQTTSMARGSEQYRTLVGDEPEIRRIAEQLDGEFIVVWKGRAYRIR